MTIKIVACKPAQTTDRYQRANRFGRGLLLGAVFVGFVAWGDMAMTQERGPEYRLEYRLEAAGRATAKSAMIKFTLTNRARDPVRIAVHNTPLKGAIETRMFAIHCDNAETPLRYKGLMRSSDGPPEAMRVEAKMQGAEALQDTVLINPGESRDATVDLAGAYPLPQTGSCKVAFTSLINVIEIDGTPGGQPKYDFVRAQGKPLVLPLTPPKD